jgi:septum formation protein
MEYKIYLASKSPRRRELLSLMGLDFEIITADADESCPEGMESGEICRELANRKAHEVFRRLKNQGKHENALVIAADTLVFLGGNPLGKPRDEADAKRMLTDLSGTTHTVCTGISVMSVGRTVSEFETTYVKFREADERDILGYIATKEPFDKAGAYGIQGLGASFVEKIDGDYFNVVGLPICRLARVLRENYGIRLF